MYAFVFSVNIIFSIASLLGKLIFGHLVEIPRCANFKLVATTLCIMNMILREATAQVSFVIRDTIQPIQVKVQALHMGGMP